MPVNTSWRCDETYIKVKGNWKYLYRAVDKHGQTIDFLLTAKRDKRAAKRFLKKAIRGSGIPQKINIDKSGANTAGIKAYNQDSKTNIEIRQCKYLNNIVEQDHRTIKRHAKMILGFKEFHSAKTIISGIEILKMIFKGQSGYFPLLHRTPIEAYWALVQS
jgi:transposase-like protein